MNFKKIKESDEVELPLLLRNRLVSLVVYIEQKIVSGQLDAMTLADIAKDNRMTIPQLMEFGFTKPNLVCHAVVAYNERMIQALVGQDITALCQTAAEQVEAYVLQMYQYDLEHMAFKTAAQSYAWHWSVVDEERYTNQVMKLMTPIYIALHTHGFDQVDARCQTIWTLYTQGLRTAALSKGDAHDCLASVREALEFITESNK
jgi:hypothetical protein